jgi:PAS domain S-box-containing protein
MSTRFTRHSLLLSAVVFTCILTGLLVIYRQLDAVETAMLDLRTQTTARQVSFRLEGFLAARLHLVRQLTHLWIQEQINTPRRFSSMAEAVMAEFSSLQAINWIDEKGFIRWVVPEQSNLPAKNRDLRNHPGLERILADAAAHNQPRASAPLNLFQGGRGVGTYFPLVREGRLEGYINGVFRIDRLVRDCLEQGVWGDFHLRIMDGPDDLYLEGPPEVFRRSELAFSYPIRVLDREWTLTLVPTDRTRAAYHSHLDEMLLVVGILLAAALSLMLNAWIRRQARVGESEQRLRLAVENMPAMVAAFDHEGRIIVWNRHCERVTGYPGAEIVGNPEARRILKPRAMNLPPGDTAPFGLARSPGQEWLIACRDGSDRVISWSNATPDLRVPGWAAWGVGDDITQRRQVEEELRITQFAMDHASIATFWIREDASFVYVNEEACRALGYTREELLGLGVFDVDAMFPASVWPEQWARINRQSVPVTFESLHRRKDGTTFPVELTTQTLAYKDGHYQFTFAKDITERRRVEEERLAMERALLETQKLESLGLLAGGVAHDFNNLLTAMLGSVSLARRGLTEESPIALHLAQVESAAEQAADLARQLLAYSGKGRFSVASIDINEAIHQTAHLLRVSVPRQVELDFQTNGEPVCVRGDASQLRQVVMNLVLNAAEAIGDAAGAVIARTRICELDRPDPAAGGAGDVDLAPGRYAVLEVTDNGCGMDARTRARIFEPFFSTKGAGRGLGLAAVVGIVRGHHGAMRIESEPGRGTTFRVFFPLCDEPPSSPPEGEPRAATSPAGGPAAAGGTILVVDDEHSVRTVARIILEDSGYTVMTAEDGEEGVRMFREHAAEIRMVLLDMTMPRMNGREALAEIRSLRPDVLVLLSSGYDEQEATTDLAGPHHTEFIQKPYRADQLMARIDQMLARG